MERHDIKKNNKNNEKCPRPLFWTALKRQPTNETNAFPEWHIKCKLWKNHVYFYENKKIMYYKTNNSEIE